MITVLAGENSFERERALRAFVDTFTGTPERIDGSELTSGQVADLFSGMSLFATQRLVIIKHLSDNKSVWGDMPTWLPRLSDDTHIILIEPKPDKRTKTYKELQKVATVHEYKQWGERDNGLAEKWIEQEAATMNVALDRPLVRKLVGRVGLDQWRLYRALQKLSVVDEVSAGVIDDVIEANSSENVFVVFEAALGGDTGSLQQILTTLRLSEEPYRLFALLAGQAFQLAVLANADRSDSEVAKAIGAHPFVLSKLAASARRLGPSGARQVIAVFDEADEAMKTTATDPWLLIERALMKVMRL